VLIRPLIPFASSASLGVSHFAERLKDQKQRIDCFPRVPSRSTVLRPTEPISIRVQRLLTRILG